MRVYSKNIIVRCIVSNELSMNVFYYKKKVRLVLFRSMKIRIKECTHLLSSTIDRIENCLYFGTDRGKFSNTSEQSVTKHTIANVVNWT